jgi:hypothetical protein
MPSTSSSDHVMSLRTDRVVHISSVGYTLYYTCFIAMQTAYSAPYLPLSLPLSTAKTAFIALDLEGMSYERL